MKPHPLRSCCIETIETLVSTTAGVGSAAVVTGDGFEVASMLRADISADRLAAMASSLLALSEAIAKELVKQPCRNVIVEAKGGSLVTIRIPSRQHELLISVLCNEASSLGSVLYATRDAARRLALRLPVS